MTNFKWKVTYYKNVNGEEKRIEKEFDDEKEYKDFIRENDLQDDELTLEDFYDDLFAGLFGEPAFHIPPFNNRNRQNKKLNERKRDGSGSNNSLQRKRRKDKSRNKRNKNSNKRKKNKKVEKLKKLRNKIDEIIKQEE